MALFRRDRTPSTPAPAPRENTIATEPATVERCNEDYAAGAQVRAKAHQQWKNAGSQQ